MRAQSSTEYLLLMGGIVAVVVVAGIFMTNYLNTTQQGTCANYTPFNTAVPVAPNGVNLVSPTGCATKTVATAGNVDINFLWGGKVSTFTVRVSNASTGAILCSSAETNINVANKYQIYSCNAMGVAAGKYDVNVTGFTVSGGVKSQMSSIEKEAITKT